MLKFKQFINEVLSPSYNEMDFINEATAGEELRDSYERFINSLLDSEQKTIEANGQIILNQAPGGKLILSDQAYVTVYPTIIKIRSKADGTKISEFKNSKKVLDRAFDNLKSTSANSTFEKAMCLVFHLMEIKPDSISWAPKDSLKKEILALNSINQKLRKISSEDGSGVVRILLGSSLFAEIGAQIVEIERVEKVPGVPRADFKFINSEEVPFLFVSHKDGRDPKGFQQYSGMTKDSNIANHPEVKEFVRIISEKMPNGYTDDFAAGFAIKVVDPKLAAYAMFGNDFGSSFGINNCHFLMQGEILIDPSTENDGCYSLSSTGHFTISPQISGSSLSEKDLGEYWPYLYVRRSKKDAQFNVNGARFMILSGRKDIIGKAEPAFNKLIGK